MHVTYGGALSKDSPSDMESSSCDDARNTADVAVEQVDDGHMGQEHVDTWDAHMPPAQLWHPACEVRAVSTIEAILRRCALWHTPTVCAPLPCRYIRWLCGDG